MTWLFLYILKFYSADIITLLSMIIIATCADMIMMDGTNPPPAQTYHIYVISVELFSDQVGRQLFLILEEIFEYSYCILLFLIILYSNIITITIPYTNHVLAVSTITKKRWYRK